MSIEQRIEKLEQLQPEPELTDDEIIERLGLLFSEPERNAVAIAEVTEIFARARARRDAAIAAGVGR